MMVSGSVSLELMARRTPAAVIYRVGRFLHTVARMMVKLDSITLPNLMNGRRVFPELVSVGSPEPGIDFLTGSVDAFLSDDFYYRRVVQSLDQLSGRYAKPGASARAAQWVGQAIGVNVRAALHEAEPDSTAKAA
jgi:lipid-A-disaccharide synthase